MRFSNFRQCLLLLLSYLSGTKNVVFINNIEDILLCEKVLKNSDKKGYGIEYHLSMSAWEPIYNIESIDGEKWKCVRKYFHMIASKIDISKLHAEFEFRPRDVLQEIKVVLQAEMG